MLLHAVVTAIGARALVALEVVRALVLRTIMIDGYGIGYRSTNDNLLRVR